MQLLFLKVNLNTLSLSQSKLTTTPYISLSKLNSKPTTTSIPIQLSGKISCQSPLFVHPSHESSKSTDLREKQMILMISNVLSLSPSLFNSTFPINQHLHVHNWYVPLHNQYIYVQNWYTVRSRERNSLENMKKSRRL